MTYDKDTNTVVFWYDLIKEDDCQEYIIDIKIEDI